MLRSRIISTGAGLPEKILTNAMLAEKVETSDEWITERTGIKQRYIAGEGETTATLAAAAAKKALEKAGVKPDSIDLIIVGTATPDNTFPATAALVQKLIGAENAFAFDVQAVCSGFVFALSVADNFLRLGQARRALVIGADVFSKILDWNDRGTCVLFGDGAGAALLEAHEGLRGIISTKLFSDGRFYNQLYVDGGVGTSQTAGYLRMNGKEVFRHAVDKMSDCIKNILEENGMSVADISWLIPHQANVRILDSVAKKLGLPMEKVVISVDKHANTSAASIPLALDGHLAQGGIKEGDVVVLAAMGGGFSWGASLLKW